MIFLCTLFTTDGSSWCVYLRASSWESAQKQANDLGIRLDGELIEEIPFND